LGLRTLSFASGTTAREMSPTMTWVAAPPPAGSTVTMPPWSSETTTNSASPPWE
jgi:hypothetical protein